MEPAPPAGSYHTDEDERILHKLGYAQELFRAMGGFQNFAISFTIISILAGCLTSYYIAFGQGGPVAVSWGWLLVGGMSIIVSLAMAEIVFRNAVKLTFIRFTTSASARKIAYSR